MTRQKQTADAQKKQQNQRSHKPRTRLNPPAGQVAPIDLMTGLLGPADEVTPQTQAARLDDPRLQTTRRQAMAAQLGRVGGNRYLRRVMATRTKDISSPETDEEIIAPGMDEAAGPLPQIHAANDVEIQRNEGDKEAATTAPSSGELAWDIFKPVAVGAVNSLGPGILKLKLSKHAGEVVAHATKVQGSLKKIKSYTKKVEDMRKTVGPGGSFTLKSVGKMNAHFASIAEP